MLIVSVILLMWWAPAGLVVYIGQVAKEWYLLLCAPTVILVSQNWDNWMVDMLILWVTNLWYCTLLIKFLWVVCMWCTCGACSSVWYVFLGVVCVLRRGARSSVWYMFLGVVCVPQWGTCFSVWYVFFGVVCVPCVVHVSLCVPICSTDSCNNATQLPNSISSWLSPTFHFVLALGVC